MKLGTITHTYSIGRKGQAKLIWSACVDCGKERWVQMKKGKPESLRCNSCSRRLANKSMVYKTRYGDKAPCWKGGIYTNKEGYVQEYVNLDSLYRGMANKQGYVPQHRLVIAKSLGRCLVRTEQVHHINGIKDDNRLENLQLLSMANHSIKTLLCSHCELRKEVRLLRWQLKELSKQLQGKLE